MIVWKDISTAPKDGTNILLLCGGMIIEGYWDRCDGWSQCIIGVTYDMAYPVFEYTPKCWAKIPLSTYE